MFPFEDVRLDITHVKFSQNDVLMDNFRTYATCIIFCLVENNPHNRMEGAGIRNLNLSRNQRFLPAIDRAKAETISGS